MYYTIAEICKKYNIGRRTVDAAVHSMELKSYQINKKTKLICEAEFIQWIQSKLYDPLEKLKGTEFRIVHSGRK